MQYHNDTIIKTQEDFLINTCTYHFIVRVRKGLFRVCVWEGAGDRTERQYFDPHSYGRQRCVFLVLQMLKRRPRGSLCWVMAFFTASYQQLLWIPTQSEAPSPFSLVWLSLPHLVYNSVRSLTATFLTSVLTELNNSSTSTQSPTRSLKSHVWSSSNGNNRHAVHRSLSSGASVYEGIFFTSSDFVSQFPPTRFPLITAIKMCHFLPVHHLGMAFLAGSKGKIQQLFHHNYCFRRNHYLLLDIV